MMCKCGGQMVRRQSKFGEFYGCGRFPVCKNTKPLRTKSKPKLKQKQNRHKQKTDKMCQEFNHRRLAKRTRDFQYGSSIYVPKAVTQCGD